MADPNDFQLPIFIPQDLPGRPPPTKGIELERFEEEEILERIQSKRGGLPAVVLPFPEPGTPAARPSFPTGPAANDPIFSRATSVLRAGGIVVGVAVLIDLAVRYAQEEQINEEQRERDELDRLMARRSGADNPLPIILIDAPLDQPLESDAEIFEKISPPRVQNFPKNPAETPIEIPNSPQFPSEFPSQVPEISPQPVELPEQAPGRGKPDVAPELDPLPDALPEPGADPVPLKDPELLPEPETRPGFGVPQEVTFPDSPPVQFPEFPPVQDPQFRPVGDPVGSPLSTPFNLTDFEPGSLDLPQPQPQPQTDPQRRCKPCPEEEPPEPREKCFKGGYKEGRMDDDLEFFQWAQIDCETGKELTKKEIEQGDQFDPSFDNVVDLFT